MRFMEKLKKCFTCSGNSFKFKSSCFAKSSCCKGNVEIDVDGDGKTDIELRKKDSELEVIIHKEGGTKSPHTPKSGKIQK